MVARRSQAHKPTALVALIACLAALGSATGSVLIHRLQGGQRGTEEFKIAVIADPQGAWDNLANSVDWLIDRASQENIKGVFIVGDLSSAATVGEFRRAREELNRLNSYGIPWIPLIGNHDMWPNDGGEAPAEDETRTGPEQNFDTIFGPQYDTLGSGHYPDVTDWSRCQRKIWNWNSSGSPVLPGFGGVIPHYSRFQFFSFTIGDIHFVCLDLNSRLHVKPPWSWFSCWRTGTMPDGDLFPENIYGDVRSVVLHGPVDEWVDLHKGQNYGGTTYRIWTNGMPKVVNLNTDWRLHTKSLSFSSSLLDSVVLCSGRNGSGRKRVFLDPTDPHTVRDGGIPDLRINNPWSWWHDDVADHAGMGTDHTMILSHHTPTEINPMDFTIGEELELSDFLVDYKNDVGHWISGHWHPWNLLHNPAPYPWLEQFFGVYEMGLGIDPPFGIICPSTVCPGNNSGDGVITLFTCRHVQGLDEDTVEGVDSVVASPSPWFPALQDTVTIRFRVLNDGFLTIRVACASDSSLFAVLADSEYYAEGDSYSLAWNGEWVNQVPVEPGQACNVEFWRGDGYVGGSSFSAAILPESSDDVSFAGNAVPGTASEIDSGCTFEPSFDVINMGTTTRSYTVRMRIGPYYDQSQQVVNHEPGEYKHVTFQPATADWALGRYVVRCSLEVADDLDTNNAFADSFTVLPVPPSPPNLASPCSGQQSQPVAACLVWLNAARADSYDVYVDSVYDPPAASPITVGCTDTTWGYAGLLNSTTYYWHVAARNVTGDTTSAIDSFTTKAAEIQNPTGGGFFDATRNESIFVEFGVTGYARVSVGIPSHNVHLVLDTVLEPEVRHRFYWSGRDADGRLVVPGQYYLQIFASFPTCNPESTLDLTSYVGCVIKGTTVSGPAGGNWTTGNDPYVLTGNAEIDHDTSLLVDPGVRVMFSGSWNLAAEGVLSASGTSNAPILFAPYRKLEPTPDSATPGSWQGIRIGEHAESHATLDHCIIEYAGNPNGDYHDSAAIVCEKEGGLSLTNSVVRYSSTRGVWGGPNAYLTNRVTLRGDTFEHIASYPAKVLAESVGVVVNSCTFRDNTTPALDIYASSNHKVDQNAVWPCCEPGWRYDINTDGYSGNLRVYKDNPPSSSLCSLTVGAGATIRFGKDNELMIGSNSLRTGHLVAWSQGARITFTSMDTLNPSNFWKGIHISENSQAWMESCYVNCSQEAALKGENGAILVPHFCEFRKSQCGLYSAGAREWAHGCRFVQNDTGMKVTGSPGGPSYVWDCLFEGNTNYGFHANGDQYVYPLWNTFEDNGIPVRIRANLVYHPLLDSNYFPTNTWRGIEISEGSTADSRISDYACWSATPYISTYRCLGELQVCESSTDDGGGEKPEFNTETQRHEEESGVNRQDAKNANESGESGLTTKAQRHEELEPAAGMQDANSFPISDFQHQDFKARGRPNFPSDAMNYNYRHVPTPMEWARAHGVGEACADSLMPTGLSGTGPNDQAPVTNQDLTLNRQVGNQGLWKSLPVIDVSGPGGKYAAPLPQAGGNSGLSFGDPRLVLAPGCTIEFASGANCLKVGSTGTGYVTAAGQANGKITFRCAASGQQWDGIHLKSGAGNSVLKHCRILDAGHSTSKGGVSFESCNPRMERCEIADCDHVGVNIYKAAPTISGCNIHDCDTGVYVNSLNSSPTASIDSCRIAANVFGIYCANYPRATFHHCDIDSNTTYGANAYRSSLDCTNNWWGASNGPNPPGSGDNINSNVNYASFLTSRVVIEPALDVSAIGVYPSGTYHLDSLVVNPQGRAHNSYDEVLTIPTRLTVGTNYSHDQSIGLAGGQSGWLAFPEVTLHRGTHRIVYKTMLTGDVTPANDSIVDSVTVRLLRDVSARRVVEPSDPEYEIVDTVPFAVMVANNYDSALTVPVKFWLNDSAPETLSVALQPHDSSVVWFDSCVFDTEGVHHVKYATCLANDEYRQNDTVRCQFSVGPARDAAARYPITPAGLIASDTPLVVIPTGWVRNNYDETLSVPARMRIGDSCIRETLAVVPDRESVLVTFAPCTLALGSYLVSMVAVLDSDEIPANDSIAESLLVRKPIDVAVTRVLAPLDSVYTIEDLIPLGAMVANHWDSALTFPVRLLGSDTLLDQQEVEVPGLDSVEVWFDARSLRHGNCTLKFIACLDSDERRGNDTLAKTIRVKAGDYWVMLDSAPVAQARLAVDSAGCIYAAARDFLRVDFYDPGSDLWNRLSNPPVTAVYGITAVDTTVYVLGLGTYQGLGQGGGLQRLEGSTQGSQAGKTQGGTTQKLTPGPVIWRYEPENDSWLFVTACGPLVLLSSSSNLVGTHDRTIYVVGCGPQTFRYFLARDSWATVPSAPVINNWGAAGWMDGRLYAIASSSALWRFSEGDGQWSSLPGPGKGLDYGSALVCDRAAERAFAFWRQGTTGKGFSELRDTGRTAGQLTWLGRQSLASETLGAAMCFGATQGYCLDGAGGFWRYRPEPMYDLSVVGITLPESAHADTNFTPHVIVQNNWQDSLSFTLTMYADSGGGCQAPGFVIPGQTRQVLSMGSMALPPGLRTVFVDLSMTGSDSVAANDHATGTVWVPLRHDAAAVQIFGVTGGVRYDSLLHPGGVVANLWSDSLDIRVMLAVDSVYLESTVVTVPAQHSETVWFDTCRLSIGKHDARLVVGMEHDELAGNDTAWSTVDVIGNGWLAVHPASSSNPVLCDGVDSVLYAADRYGPWFYEYNMLQDSWRGLATPIVTGMISLSRAGDKVFGLATGEVAGCIKRYRTDLDQWSAVTNSVPVQLSDACGLVAQDSLTLYLVGPGGLNSFWRFDVAGDSWHHLSPLPAMSYKWVSCAFDRGDLIYVLTDLSGRVYQYDIGNDNWSLLTTLPQSMSTPAALSIDDQRNRLPALGVGTVTSAQSAEFSLPGCAWTNQVAFPGSASHPSLTVSNGRLFGTGGGSEAAATFAEYVRVTLDAAALDIVALPDTFRSDSVPHPGGVIRNLSWVPITCQVTLACGASQQQQQVQLAPMQYDTVWFSSALTYLPGVQTVSLTVSCTGDDNPGNDVYSKQVFVRAPWVPRAQSFEVGSLDSDSSSVFVAERQSNKVMQYDPAQDLWQSLRPSPLASGCLDLGYWDSNLFVLGGLSFDRAGKGTSRQKPGKSGCDQLPYAIYRLALGDTLWQAVCESLPDSTSPGWLIPTGYGLYLLPATGSKLLRYDSTGWVERAQLPTAVVGVSAADWDRLDTFFFAFVSDSGAQQFLSYSATGDTWRSLTAPPESGMALAVEPGGNRVLMMTLDSLGSVMYEYDRAEDEWTLSPDASPQAYPAMAMCFAKDDAWLMTGGPTQGSSFWRYDPDYPGGADHKGGLGGAAGWAGQLQLPCLNCEPNPFTGSCRITYALPRPGKACLKLYDVSGRLVTTLVNGYTPNGRHVTNVYSRDLANGVYVLKLESADYRATRKLILE